MTDARDGQVFPVRNALILAYQYAIARYDVDGFRIDTLKFIERDFAQTFGNAMREYALSIGKKNFFSFGEVFDGEERIAQFIGRNTQDADDLVGSTPRWTSRFSSDYRRSRRDFRRRPKSSKSPSPQDSRARHPD